MNMGRWLLTEAILRSERRRLDVALVDRVAPTDEPLEVAHEVRVGEAVGPSSSSDHGHDLIGRHPVPKAHGEPGDQR